MMASPSELSLECKPQSFSTTLLKFFGENNSRSHLHPPSQYEPLQTHTLEEYLSCLEEERLKIDAFKRELPLCMHLLTNAMEALRQQLQSYKASSANQVMIKRPILEEFIPMKHSNSEDSEDQQNAPNNKSDKASWMTSAQLWSQANELESLPTKELDMGFTPKSSLLDDDNKNNDNNVRKKRNGGAFLPFVKERSLPEREMEDKNGFTSSESGLPSENSSKVSNDIVAIDGSSQTNVNGATGTTTQPHRKQRRCWSPDLHRRFVNALQMLGGSQVATPKQIRELMKVDGLTNDEVKSHLQKYRLHTRRPGPSPQGAGAPGPQLVVLGGIWVPPEYATAAHHHHHHHGYNAQPTAQVGPHYYPPAIQREFYPSLPQAGLHQVHIYKGSSKGQSSPESHGERVARDQSESIEHGKSESSSGEEKRDGEEESNGSEIILKF